VIVAILNVYLVLLFILVKMKIVPFNLFWKCSPLIVLLLLMLQIQQIYTRYIEPGQEVEVTFKFFPGQVFAGKVVSVLAATSTGQVLTSGTAVAPTQVTAAPFVVRVKLDDAKLAASLPAGTAGDAAIYTPHIKPAHVIRKVILRQIAILNYVNPF
jgi:hypothetical protein